MSQRKFLRNLQIVTALDSLSYGVIYCFMGDYMVALGANIIQISCLMCGVYTGELLSARITNKLFIGKSKRKKLLLLLTTSLFLNFLITATTNDWIALILRIIFTCINQTKQLTYEMLLEIEQNPHNLKTLKSNHEMLSCWGYVAGPIVGGYLFQTNIRYNGLLVLILTLINILLLMNLIKREEPEIVNRPKEFLPIHEALLRFTWCILSCNWDLIALKYLITSGCMIFIGKINQSLRHNFNDNSSVHLGFYVAYVNLLGFLFSFTIKDIKHQLFRCTPKYIITELTFFLISVITFGACHAPTHIWFICLLIPFVFLKTLSLDLWHDMFDARLNKSLEELKTSPVVVTALITPLIFGIMYYHIHYQAVIVLSCVPMMMCFVITRTYTRTVKDITIEGVVILNLSNNKEL